MQRTTPSPRTLKKTFGVFAGRKLPMVQTPTITSRLEWVEPFVQVNHPDKLRDASGAFPEGTFPLRSNWHEAPSNKHYVDGSSWRASNVLVVSNIPGPKYALAYNKVKKYDTLSVSRDSRLVKSLNAAAKRQGLDKIRFCIDGIACGLNHDPGRLNISAKKDKKGVYRIEKRMWVG